MEQARVRRSWQSVVLAPAGDGATRRRGSDAFRVAIAALVVVVCWVILVAGSSLERAVLGFLHPPPSGVSWLVTWVWEAGSVGTIVVVAALALLARRPAMARDVVVAGLGAWGVAYAIEVVVGPGAALRSGPAPLHVDLHYPQPRIAVAVAVALAALPYLARGLKRVVGTIIVLTALAALVHGATLLTSVVASVALGWGIAAAVRLAFGTPLGLPSAGDVALLLGELGIPAPDVRPDPDQEWGVARYTNGDPKDRLDVAVYGRDARDAQLVAKVFRFAFYRDSGPTLTFTRLQQVEHEAYLTLLAGSHGATVPTVVTAARAGPSRDAVLVTRPPAGLALTPHLPAPSTATADRAAANGTAADGVPAEEGARPAPTADGAPGDGALDAVLDQLLALRAARIAHGSLDTDTVVVEGDRAGLVDLRRASSDADDDQLDRDLACGLATLALAAGPERAVAAARRRVPTDALVAALPFLQRAALTPALARRYRGRKAVLDDLRRQGAEAAGVEVPALTETRRISWVTLVLVLGSLIGGWALLGVLIDVGRSFDTIRGATWGWVVAVAVLAAATYPSLSLEVLGAVTEPLPYGRVLALEVADTFVGLAGGTMAVLAARVRFFQKQGLPSTLAVSSGVLISTASWITKGALFLIALPFGLSAIDFGEHPVGGSAHTVWIILVVVVVVGLLLGLVLAVPRIRRVARDKLRPKAADVGAQLRSLAARPRKLVEIFGGALGAQLAVVLALSAALLAFGDHLSVATLLVVMTLASMVGGASPVPGGVGVVEAGLILGLTAAGIPEDHAVAAVFVQRLFTSYLPPVAGWVTMVALRRQDYL